MQLTLLLFKVVVFLCCLPNVFAAFPSTVRPHICAETTSARTGKTRALPSTPPLSQRCLFQQVLLVCRGAVPSACCMAALRTQQWRRLWQLPGQEKARKPQSYLLCHGKPSRCSILALFNEEQCYKMVQNRQQAPPWKNENCPKAGCHAFVLSTIYPKTIMHYSSI